MREVLSIAELGDVDKADLIQRYPVLWHMAEPANLPSILRDGLWSTSMLLDRFEIAGEEREAIERRHRAEIVAISHHRFGRVLIRDQKPLSIEGLRRGLTDRSDPYDFLAFLNGRVFFWLSESRLARMTNAAAYRDEERPVLVFDTELVVTDYEEKILLSPINSGATKPFPAKRSISMFQPIGDFDFEARRKSADPIVELTVADGLADVSKYLVRQEVWKAGRLIRRL